MQTAYKYTMICVTIFNTGMLFNILKKKDAERSREDRPKEGVGGGRKGGRKGGG